MAMRALTVWFKCLVLFWHKKESNVALLKIEAYIVEDDEDAALTVVVVFVPLDVWDHAGHVHGAEEPGRVPHLQAHVLRRLQDVGQPAHFHCK